MSDQRGERSPLYDLKIYNEITPILLISLGSLYISILLFRYLKWRYHKQKAKKMRMDRRKLEKFWTKRTAYLSQQSIQKPLKAHPRFSSSEEEEEEGKRPAMTTNYFDSNTTLVISSSGSHNQFAMYPELKEEEDSIMNESRQHTIVPIRTSSSSSSSSHYYHFKESKSSMLNKVTHRMDGKYQQRKRRQLLWQWSVAMGYCRYNHAYHLNLLIDRLSKQDNYNHHCI
ncbi:hypothetical protein BD770DRAFT_409371 [Pilaira anomala]|nr:hypothetical protein BD770DRAFT_409371 [Pilaira anomala]